MQLHLYWSIDIKMSILMHLHINAKGNAMNAEPDDSVVQAWARLMRAQRITLASIEQALKSAGLPPLVWYDVLLELERAGDRGLRPFELEREMLLAQYNLSRLIERIEKAGYVERRACEGDGRGQIVVATDAGKKMRQRMWAVYGPTIQKAVGGRLPPNQIEALHALLGTLIGKPARQ
jgi:DNA-binding MarR family transcriptional regulator